MKAALIVPIVVLGLTAGCSLPRPVPRTYVIREEVAEQVTESNYIDRYDELLYLVRKGNPKATRAVVSLLPGLIKGQCSCCHGDADDGDAVIALAILGKARDFHFLDQL